MAGLSLLSRRPWVDARIWLKIQIYSIKTEAQTRLGIKMLCCRCNVSLWNLDSARAEEKKS